MATSECANCGSALDAEAEARCEGCGAWWTPEILTLALSHRRPAPEGCEVSLVYEPNGTDHDDVVTRFGSHARRSDSYYHLFDDAKGEEPDDARASIEGMLRLWLVSIRDESRRVIYLPFDLSDQATGWIQVTGLGSHLELAMGYSHDAGLRPSDFLKVSAKLHNWSPTADVPPLQRRRSELIHDVRMSIEELKGTN